MKNCIKYAIEDLCPDIPESPLYRYLKEISGYAPTWNFWKYLIDQSGNIVAVYGHWQEPNEIESDIQALLRKEEKTEL